MHERLDNEVAVMNEKRGTQTTHTETTSYSKAMYSTSIRPSLVLKK
jgi:hypothetical protein